MTRFILPDDKTNLAEESRVSGRSKKPAFLQLGLLNLFEAFPDKFEAPRNRRQKPNSVAMMETLR